MNNRDLIPFFRNKNVFISGYTGFKGSWLTKVLSGWGAKLTGIALSPASSPNLFEILKLKNNIKGYIGDIRDFDLVHQSMSNESPEIVIHLAAQAIVRDSYDDPLKTYSTNVMGMVNILESIRLTPSVKSVVLITTDKVYENKEWIYPYRENDPLGGYDPYSASKASADIVAQSYINSFFNLATFGSKHRTLIAIARAGNVIGGGDWSNNRLVPDIIRAIFEKKEPVILRSPNSIRPWEHVLEPLSGYLLLAKKMFEGDMSSTGPWNFGPNDDAFSTVEDLLKCGIKLIGSGSYKNEIEMNKHEATLLKLDTTKAKSLLNWHPRLSFEENLKYTFEWYKKYYEAKININDFTEKQIKNYFEKP